MIPFHSIKELIKTLGWSADLLSEMFQKRKSFTYKYDLATEMLDEDKVDRLIGRGVLRRNSDFVEMDEVYVQFFEQVLEVNEEINTAYVNENIQQLKQKIEYYFQENNQARKYGYLKAVKSILGKTSRIIARSVVDLSRNVENTFKTEPNYKIKISKLHNLDSKRQDIANLILNMENFLSQDELTFFKTAYDDELKQITILLRLGLQEARHNLIEIEKQIIDFLNQIKYQSKVLEKLRQLKYLKDQFEIREKTDINQVLASANVVCFETRPTYPLNLSLDLLQDDWVRPLIEKLNQKIQVGNKPKLMASGKIPVEFLQENIAKEVFVNVELVKNAFVATSNDLFSFVLGYNYPKELSLEQKLGIYCQIISEYENEVRILDQYQNHLNIEYAMVYPR